MTTAGDTITSDQLSALADRIHERMGLFFPPSRWGSLASGVARLAARDGGQDPGRCASGLLAREWSPAQVESLAQELTIGETGFFRHAEQWELLKQRILPELAAARGERQRPLRFWSAACSSGEEAYSIAICLEQVFGTGGEVPFQITGTDINPAALAKARNAEYTEWSFRETPASVRAQYFQAGRPNRIRLAPHIRDQVSFAHYNLFDAGPAPDGLAGVDVIFCRNVLIYFSPEKVAQLVCRLHEALAPDGCLIVSPAEVPFISEELFTIERFEETHYFRKRPEVHPDAGLVQIEIEPRQRSLLGVVPGHHASESHASPHHAAGHRSPPRHAAARHHPPLPAPAAAPKLAKRMDPKELQAVQALFSRGEYEAVLERLPAGEPAGLEDRRLRLRSLANLGRTEQALAEIAPALAAHKTEADLHYLHASLLEEADDVVPALAAVRRALFLDGGFIMGHVLLGHLLASQGKAGDAARSYRHALKLLASQPDDAVVPESESLTAVKLRAVLASLVEAAARGTGVKEACHGRS